ncbi:MAG: mannose-1-phosphate guanylyltransferase [Candidatus Aminicenantes bacterium]|jgi:mannose-1-phosphate guanylyltransferase
MDLRVIILAGGAGTRFWPVSRKIRPKQFLPIVSEKTMIEETIDRLSSQVPLKNIYTIANAEKTEMIKSILPNLPEKNLLVEPAGRNTAPSLILATAWIHHQNPKAVMAALPADHLIRDSAHFLRKLEAAAAAASSGDYLITFGIPPTSPATGYGYIRFSSVRPIHSLDEPFYAVQEFKEKPDLKQAKAFLKRGNYFWNSGMFLWQADVFGRKLERFAPGMFSYWTHIREALKSNDEARIVSLFEDIPSISIDYALMEKAEGVLMARGDFGWSDVGVWSSLTDIWPQNKAGNVLRGDNIILDSRDCLVYNPDKLTALIGVKDIIVVNTEDALLIAHRDQDQKVKDIVGNLEKKKKTEYL